MTPDIEFSRPAAAAERLGGMAEDRHAFLDKRVLLRGEPATLRSAIGRLCFLASLRLLPRICRNVTVELRESEDLVEEARRILMHANFAAAQICVDAPTDLHSFDAILSVGPVVRTGLPWTAITCDGWLARVSSKLSLPEGRYQANPVAALAAASLGTAEIFKRLISLKDARGSLLDSTVLNLLNYSTEPTEDPGPPLPPRISINALLAGVGAIGNGVLFVLAALPLAGRLEVIDNQDFGRENLGTCIMIGPADISTPKAHLAERLFSGPLVVHCHAEDVETALARLGSDNPPALVLGCLDNVRARHALQSLWADLTLDGAIGDFGVQVSRHPWVGDTACLRCLFPLSTGPNTELLASRATGLSVERVVDAESVITEADVASAPQTRQGWLSHRLGQRLCSVVAEGVAQLLSCEPLQQGFEPSVPFVACMSGAMLVAEVVKSALGLPSPLEPRFQMDILQGPATGLALQQTRRRDCYCVTRRHNIELVREHRRWRALVT